MITLDNNNQQWDNGFHKYALTLYVFTKMCSFIKGLLILQKEESFGVRG